MADESGAGGPPLCCPHSPARSARASSARGGSSKAPLHAPGTAPAPAPVPVPVWSLLAPHVYNEALDGWQQSRLGIAIESGGAPDHYRLVVAPKPSNTAPARASILRMPLQLRRLRRADIAEVRAADETEDGSEEEDSDEEQEGQAGTSTRSRLRLADGTQWALSMHRAGLSSRWLGAVRLSEEQLRAAAPESDPDDYELHAILLMREAGSGRLQAGSSAGGLPVLVGFELWACGVGSRPACSPGHSNPPAQPPDWMRALLVPLAAGAVHIRGSVTAARPAPPTHFPPAFLQRFAPEPSACCRALPVVAPDEATLERVRAGASRRNVRLIDAAALDKAFGEERLRPLVQRRLGGPVTGILARVLHMRHSLRTPASIAALLAVLEPEDLHALARDICGSHTRIALDLPVGHVRGDPLLRAVLSSGAPRRTKTVLQLLCAPPGHMRCLVLAAAAWVEQAGPVRRRGSSSPAAPSLAGVCGTAFAAMVAAQHAERWLRRLGDAAPPARSLAILCQDLRIAATPHAADTPWAAQIAADIWISSRAAGAPKDLRRALGKIPVLMHPSGAHLTAVLQSHVRASLRRAHRMHNAAVKAQVRLAEAIEWARLGGAAADVERELARMGAAEAKAAAADQGAKARQRALEQWEEGGGSTPASLPLGCAVCLDEDLAAIGCVQDCGHRFCMRCFLHLMDTRRCGLCRQHVGPRHSPVLVAGRRADVPITEPPHVLTLNNTSEIAEASEQRVRAWWTARRRRVQAQEHLILLRVNSIGATAVLHDEELGATRIRHAVYETGAAQEPGPHHFQGLGASWMRALPSANELWEAVRQATERAAAEGKRPHLAILFPSVPQALAALGCIERPVPATTLLVAQGTLQEDCVAEWFGCPRAASAVYPDAQQEFGTVAAREANMEASFRVGEMLDDMVDNVSLLRRGDPGESDSESGESDSESSESGDELEHLQETRHAQQAPPAQDAQAAHAQAEEEREPSHAEGGAAGAAEEASEGSEAEEEEASGSSEFEAEEEEASGSSEGSEAEEEEASEG
jgi:hypothetical protein